MKVRININISGVVQGVGFRYFVHNCAKNFNLSGYVMNLYSGDVEIEAEGERSLIEEFISLIKVGHRSANVVDLKLKWIKCLNNNSDFIIK